jgi:rhamnulokinase
MIPDLIHGRLCDVGPGRGEYTNATTTQLVDPRTGHWDDVLFDRLGLPRALMPDLARPGDLLGTLSAAVASDLGLPALDVVAPATHDTGSAVAGTPLRPGWAYISSGTWSLVGVERDGPLLDASVAAASFTNEGGAFGTVRFLKNVMGLWILESCRKEWAAAGIGEPDYERLLSEAAGLPRCPGWIYPDDPRFFNPKSMTAELRAALREGGAADVAQPAALTRVILDSLALRYASVVAAIETLTGAAILGLHVVGGGCLNTYLDQATATATGRPVLAGPVEATAIGSLLVQAIAAGDAASLAEARDRVARAFPPREFEPQPSAAWREAKGRYGEIEARASSA